MLCDMFWCTGSFAFLHLQPTCCHGVVSQLYQRFVLALESAGGTKGAMSRSLAVNHSLSTYVFIWIPSACVLSEFYTHTHTDFHIYKCTIGVNYADDPVGAGLCGALDTMDRSPQSELGGPILFSFFIVVIIYDACF